MKINGTSDKNRFLYIDFGNFGVHNYCVYVRDLTFSGHTILKGKGAKFQPFLLRRSKVGDTLSREF